MRLLAKACLLLCPLALVCGAQETAKPEDRKAAEEEKKLLDLLKKASPQGKYRMLLRQISVPDDKDTYGDFNEYGKYSGTSYAGHNDLPEGYWVYAAPYWYIWGASDTDPKQSRSWGPEQATGQPNTTEAGDFDTAWASATPDGQDEWMMLEYATAIVPKEIHISETYNPGAVIRVTAFKLDGQEVEIWKGKDPSAGKDIGVSIIPNKLTFKTNRIKLYIASRAVQGWNEIDAVGLKDDKGKMSWAVNATASTFFGQQAPPPAVAPEQRIRQLEKEVADLKELLRKLEQALEKQEKEKKQK